MEHFYLFSFYKCRRNKENGTGRFMVLKIFRNKWREGLTMKMFHATFNVLSTEDNPELLCTSAEVTHLFTGENILLPHAQAIYAPAFHRTHTQLRCCCPPTTQAQPSPAWPAAWKKHLLKFKSQPTLPWFRGFVQAAGTRWSPSFALLSNLRIWLYLFGLHFAAWKMSLRFSARAKFSKILMMERVFSIFVINMHSNVCSHRSSF